MTKLHVKSVHIVIEIVDHDQHNLQECSQCEFASKCWAEYNLHWRKTPDHIFSVDQLREMGYQLYRYEEKIMKNCYKNKL